MSETIRLPELGENVETAVVVAVLVSPGDEVAAEAPLLELETEKATAELPSPRAGVIEEILVAVGDEVRVGDPVVTMAAAGGSEESSSTETPRDDDASSAPSEPAEGGSRPEEAARPDEAPRGASPTAAEPGPEELPPPRSGVPADAPESLIPAGPSVRRLARELGIDLGTVRGSGPGGRISVDDVKAAARELVAGDGSGRPPDRAPAEAKAPATTAATLPDLSEWGEVEREPMTGVRRKTAATIARSWALVPQVTQNDKADVTDLELLRKKWGPRAEEEGGKLTVTALVIKVVASALKVFPKLNAAVDVGASEVVYRRYVHVGVAVDAGHGLLVPVIRDADRKNVLQIASELTDLSARARGKKLTIEEMRGAGFTVTNLGGLGTTTFTPIVSWPEVGILGVGRAEPTPVWDGESFVPRTILPLSLSYDHRLVDGADAARFLRWIAEALEDPQKLVMEG